MCFLFAGLSHEKMLENSDFTSGRYWGPNNVGNAGNSDQASVLLARLNARARARMAGQPHDGLIGEGKQNITSNLKFSLEDGLTGGGKKTEEKQSASSYKQVITEECVRDRSHDEEEALNYKHTKKKKRRDREETFCEGTNELMDQLGKTVSEECVEEFKKKKKVNYSEVKSTNEIDQLMVESDDVIVNGGTGDNELRKKKRKKHSTGCKDLSDTFNQTVEEIGNVAVCGEHGNNDLKAESLKKKKKHKREKEEKSNEECELTGGDSVHDNDGEVVTKEVRKNRKKIIADQDIEQTGKSNMVTDELNNNTFHETSKRRKKKQNMLSEDNPDKALNDAVEEPEGTVEEDSNRESHKKKKKKKRKHEVDDSVEITTEGDITATEGNHEISELHKHSQNYNLHCTLMEQVEEKTSHELHKKKKKRKRSQEVCEVITADIDVTAIKKTEDDTLQEDLPSSNKREKSKQKWSEQELDKTNIDAEMSESKTVRRMTELENQNTQPTLANFVEFTVSQDVENQGQEATQKSRRKKRTVTAKRRKAKAVAAKREKEVGGFTFVKEVASAKTEKVIFFLSFLFE